MDGHEAKEGCLPLTQVRRLGQIGGHLVPAAPAGGRQRSVSSRVSLSVESVAAAAAGTGDGYVLSPEHAYQFDVNGFFVLRGHYGPEDVAEFNRGIDELQAIPVTHAEYTKRGIAHPALHAAQADPDHDVWKQHKAGASPPLRVDHAICGTTRWDRIVRDPILRKIHETLAGGAIMLSATYYIEKHGPGAPGGGLHFGGFPRQRNFHYDYDHTNARFNCYSTKATICLSDMSSVEHGPFACIPGSHKANLACPYDMVFEGNTEGNPMVVPVCASPGDVVIFTEGITHNAFPVLSATRRRSLFFNWVPAIDRNNLPSQRMSIFPEHVLRRFPEPELQNMLTAPGYI